MIKEISNKDGISKYKSDKNVDTWSVTTGAVIIESTKTTCTVETTYEDSISFKLTADDATETFVHRRIRVVPNGRTDINNIEPAVAPQESQYKHVEAPALTELI